MREGRAPTLPALKGVDKGCPPSEHERSGLRCSSHKTPGLQATVALGGKGVEMDAGAVDIGQKALGVGVETLDAAAGPLGGVHSNSMPLASFLDRCATEERLATERFENCLDFNKKYDESSADPVIDLGETQMAWCLVYKLEQTASDRQKSENDTSGTLVPRECVDLCLRLWAVDVEVHCKTAADYSEIYITMGLTYEMLVDEAQFVNLPMRLNDAMGSTQFQGDKMHH